MPGGSRTHPGPLVARAPRDTLVPTISVMTEAEAPGLTPHPTPEVVVLATPHQPIPTPATPEVAGPR